MTFELLGFDWIEPGEWWFHLGQIETPNKQGFLFLIGRTSGRWEFDILWLGLFNVRIT